MASFFDNLGGKLSDFGKSVSEKVNTASDASRLNSLIRDEEKQMESLFTQMGKMFYEKLKTQEYPEPEFSELFRTIQTCEKSIADHKLEVMRVKGLCNCENCGAEIEINARFCPKCGAVNKALEQLEETQKAAAAAADAAVKICPNCGAKLAPNALFCAACGSRVEG